MITFCTICSRNKKKDKKLLPAIERYSSVRIRKIYEKSQSNGNEFRILSGKFGLLNPEDKIKWYDEKLLFEKIPMIEKKVENQINEAGITKIYFFGKKEKNWLPYIQLLKIACKKTKVELSFTAI